LVQVAVEPFGLSRGRPCIRSSRRNEKRVNHQATSVSSADVGLPARVTYHRSAAGDSSRKHWLKRSASSSLLSESSSTSKPARSAGMRMSSESAHPCRPYHAASPRWRATPPSGHQGLRPRMARINRRHAERRTLAMLASIS
jgi:hypothetical protein